MFVRNFDSNSTSFFPANPYPTVTERQRRIAQQINNTQSHKHQGKTFNPGPAKAFHNLSILEFKHQSPIIPPAINHIINPGPLVIPKEQPIQVAASLSAQLNNPVLIPSSSQIFNGPSQLSLAFQQNLPAIITPQYQQLLQQRTQGVQMSMINRNPQILQHDPMMMLRDSVITKLDVLEQEELTQQQKQDLPPLPKQSQQLDLELERISSQMRMQLSSVLKIRRQNMRIISTQPNNLFGQINTVNAPKTRARGIGLVTQTIASQQMNNFEESHLHRNSNGNSAISNRTITDQLASNKNQLNIQIHQQKCQQEQTNIFNSPQPNQKYAKPVAQIPLIPARILQIIKYYKSKQKLKNASNLNHQRGNSLGPYYIPSKHAYYLGEWANGLPHGLGKVIFDSNAYFQGFFINGEAYCKDALWIYSDNSYYIGDIERSEPDGIGKMVYRNCELIYEGQWKSGKPHGKGKQTFKDGSVYQGEFNQGLKNGIGKFVWSDGSTYQGQFQDGFMEGRGSRRDSNGRVFVGQFHKNLMSGQGRCQTNLGEYIGQFVLNKRHGKGVFQSTNGDTYEGQFKNDYPHGQGKLILPTGKVIQGVWEEGKNISISKAYSIHQILNIT